MVLDDCKVFGVNGGGGWEWRWWFGVEVLAGSGGVGREWRVPDRCFLKEVGYQKKVKEIRSCTLE